MQARHDLAIYLFAGDDRVNHGQRCDCGQHDFAEFGVICYHDALARAFDHRAFGPGLLEIELGQSMFDSDAADADKGFVDLEAAQCLLCEMPDQRKFTGAQLASDHDDLDGCLAGEFQGCTKIGYQHRQVAFTFERACDF